MEIVKFKPNELFISIGFVTDYGVFKNKNRKMRFCKIIGVVNNLLTFLYCILLCVSFILVLCLVSNVVCVSGAFCLLYLELSVSLGLSVSCIQCCLCFWTFCVLYLMLYVSLDFLCLVSNVACLWSFLCLVSNVVCFTGTFCVLYLMLSVFLDFLCLVSNVVCVS